MFCIEHWTTHSCMSHELVVSGIIDQRHGTKSGLIHLKMFYSVIVGPPNSNQKLSILSFFIVSTPDSEGWYSIYLPRRDGRLS